MVRRQSLEKAIDMLSLAGGATTAEEVEHDLDRLASILELRCEAARGRGVSEPAIELVKSQLLTIARRLEGQKDVLYAHARLAQI